MATVIDDLERRVALAAGAANVADGALVAAMVEALASDGWQQSGIHSPVQWVCLRAGLGRHRAVQVVRVARRAGELPTTVGLLAEGKLSLDQAAVVARYVPGEFEASVCELAVNATVNQLVHATRRYVFDTDATDDTGNEKRVERSVAFGSDAGQWWSRVRLPVDEGLVVEQALLASKEKLHDAARARAKDAAGERGERTTGTDADLGVARVGWADALVGVAHAALATGAEGADASSRVGVLVHLEAPGPDAADQERWRAEVHGGRPLPPSLRRLLTCDADTAPVWHRDGHPVQVGRTRRDVPRRARRLVEHRDQHCCQVPGCNATLWLQVHHIVHWEDHGETTTANLLCLCAHHHRLHHQGLLGITGNADQPDTLVFTDTTGRVIAPSRPQPPPPGSPPPTVVYDGPTGERLHPHDIIYTRLPATAFTPAPVGASP